MEYLVVVTGGSSCIASCGVYAGYAVMVSVAGYEDGVGPHLYIWLFAMRFGRE